MGTQIQAFSSVPIVMNSREFEDIHRDGHWCGNLAGYGGV